MKYHESLDAAVQFLRRRAGLAPNMLIGANEAEAINAVLADRDDLRAELKAERDWQAVPDGPLHEAKRLRQIERDWGRMYRELAEAREECERLRRLLGEAQR